MNLPVGSLELVGKLFEAFWRCPEASWGLWEGFWEASGACWEASWGLWQGFWEASGARKRFWVILNQFWKQFWSFKTVPKTTFYEHFPKICWDQIFDRLFIDFESFFGEFWKLKSATKSIEIMMNFAMVVHIDFGTICDRLLSRHCTPFRRAVMPKLTYVLRERIVQKQCKNHMKLQTFVYRMYRRLGSFSRKFQKNWV